MNMFSKITYFDVVYVAYFFATFMWSEWKKSLFYIVLPKPLQSLSPWPLSHAFSITLSLTSLILTVVKVNFSWKLQILSIFLEVIFKINKIWNINKNVILLCCHYILELNALLKLSIDVIFMIHWLQITQHPLSCMID